MNSFGLGGRSLAFFSQSDAAGSIKTGFELINSTLSGLTTMKYLDANVTGSERAYSIPS